ncbi:MAG: lipid-A-disaccharide synthase [Deltaproteobacteria bacterium]|nr:lipid-A-disaccharide synthase [Deltaproteobacteria bacterium]
MPAVVPRECPLVVTPNGPRPTSRDRVSGRPTNVEYSPHVVRAPPNILIVAGEASGDLHASALLRELKARAPGLRAFGMGGSLTQAEGLEALADARDISVMGLVEVLPAIPRILGVMNKLAAAARERKPDVAILVDLPDFNLRLAKKLHALGIPVAYYVSPTVWAWRKGRLKTIQRYVARMMCIFPFEERFYAENGVQARYVGNPTLDELGPPLAPEAARKSLGLDPDPTKPVLALLPGSRRGEVTRIFPAMLQAARLLLRERPGLRIVVPVAPTLDRELLTSTAAAYSLPLTLVDGRAPDVVAASDAAVVASGTAVLEAGLMQRPMVVVYRVSQISFWIAKLLVKVAHVAIVNLLAGKEIVPELLQADMQPERIAGELRRLLDDPVARSKQLQGLAEVRTSLGQPGASARAADEVLGLLTPTGVEAPTNRAAR